MLVQIKGFEEQQAEYRDRINEIRTRLKDAQLAEHYEQLAGELEVRWVVTCCCAVQHKLLAQACLPALSSVACSARAARAESASGA